MNWRSFFFGLLAGSGLYITVKWIQGNRMRQKKAMLPPEVECFLFTPQTVLTKCVKRQSFFCSFISCPICSYKKFLSLIKTASFELDVCVYLITAKEIADTLINLSGKGVFVRIITDKTMSDQACNSKVCVFVKEHIPIKIIEVEGIMHNKFVIIDGKVLVTGSFNWTIQGTTSNFENGVVLRNQEVVRKFKTYFDQIWLTAKQGSENVLPETSETK